RARNFVGKIHMARRVDQVQTVGVSIFRFVVQANAFRFDGDAALALQVHRVENLFVHFTLGKRAGHFEQAVGQRGFAVVDVRNDAEIPYALWIHVTRLSPSAVPTCWTKSLVVFSRQPIRLFKSVTEPKLAGTVPALRLLLLFSITRRSRFF